MFLGPLKALRRDPPVIYLVLRPWQNLVGIEAGLLLAVILLLVGFSGWPGGRLALYGLPVCLAMVAIGVTRMFFRHRIRIDRSGVYREQQTPGSRLTEEWPAADVLSVHVLPVPAPTWWAGTRWRTGVALTFRNGDLWQLTAGHCPWRERHLAKAVATVIQAPVCDRTILGGLPRDARDTRVLIGDTEAGDVLPPADPGLTVRDTVPRRYVVVTRHPAGGRVPIAVGLLATVEAVGGWAAGAPLPLMALNALLGVALLALGADAIRHRQELELGIHHLTIRRRGWWPARPVTIPWRSITVLGRDAALGGLLIAQSHTQDVVGIGLAPHTVDWLVARLRAYLPAPG